jgi:hypothetical protein
VPEGASPDRNAGGIVTGHLAVGGDQRLLPVLGTPHAGVGGVDRNDREALFGGFVSSRLRAAHASVL